MKHIFLPALLLISSVCYSQLTTPAETLQKLKPGIYKSWKEYISNSPSVTDSFLMIPNYRYTSRDSTDSIPNGAAITIKDTVLTGFHFKMVNTTSTKKQKAVFGMFDGKNLYIRKFGLLGLDYEDGEQIFLKADYIGRYPFVLSKQRRKLNLLTVSLLAVADANIAKVPEDLYYFNKSGDFLPATPQAVGFLLRKDKDLFDAFNKEKVINNNTYIKYLVKMNERYPL